MTTSHRSAFILVIVSVALFMVTLDNLVVSAAVLAVGALAALFVPGRPAAGGAATQQDPAGVAVTA